MMSCQSEIADAFAALPPSFHLTVLTADDGTAYGALEGLVEDETVILTPAHDGSHVAALSEQGVVIARASGFADLRSAIFTA